jgi:hypothetical protein
MKTLHHNIQTRHLQRYRYTSQLNGAYKYRFLGHLQWMEPADNSDQCRDFVNMVIKASRGLMGCDAV